MREYKKSNISLARSLRKRQTPYEAKLWYCFLRDYPLRFQRQKPIADYIVDFYCAKARLVIELDGSGHYFPVKKEQDRIRDEALAKLGLYTARFSNDQIATDFETVCNHIDNLARKRSGQQ